jgi:hypothetical protein
MSDEVTVEFDDQTRDNAVLLLAAAEDLDLDPHVVRTVEGAFVVPKAVYDKAFPHKGKKKKSESEEA